jgi:hypothetical protein
VRIGVVVPCTESKRASSPGQRLRDIAPGPQRAARWLTAAGNDPHRVPAQSLYKGVGWRASADLIRTAELLGEAEALIVSAGYGALQATEEIGNYSATFVPGHADSIVRENAGDIAAGNEKWWTELNELRGDAGPVATLATNVDALFVAASARYIDALGDDLAAATTMVPTIIFSAGRPRDERLYAFAPRFDRRLREGATPFVRANDQSLNQRVAAAVIARLGEGAVDPTTVRNLLGSAMDRPPPVRHERRVVSDAAITRFIERSLRADPRATKSVLLRRWRDAGRACEQRRFGRLFDGVRAAHPEEVTSA